VNVPRVEKEIGHTIAGGLMVAVFTCTECGGQTSYDPFQCTSRGRSEEHDGKRYWCLYVLVRCAHCPHEEMVFWTRTEIKDP
jgi:hypothetical protein